jgi:exonuclease VII large subunit
MIPTEAENVERNLRKTPEAIEREIERTRQELDRTLAALEARLSPRRRLKEGVASVRENGQRLAGEVAAMVKRDPMPFAVVGGTVLLAIVAGMAMRKRAH